MEENKEEVYEEVKYDDPKNILLLCTSEGTYANFDKKGRKKYLHYALCRIYK